MIDIDVGLEVINKRNNVKGVVIKKDEESIFIDIPNTGIKCVTHNNFKKWWEVVNAEETEVEDCTEEKENNYVAPSGEFGIGDKLCDKFISIIKSYEDDTILVFYKTPKHLIVKCNNKIIFDVTICRRKLVVMAHPNSLTPDNMRRVTKLYPKSWNNSLRAKFVFCDVDQTPLMKTIISDGIFYRQNI